MKRAIVSATECTDRADLEPGATWGTHKTMKRKSKHLDGRGDIHGIAHGELGENEVAIIRIVVRVVPSCKVDDGRPQRVDVTLWRAVAVLHLLWCCVAKCALSHLHTCIPYHRSTPIAIASTV